MFHSVFELPLLVLSSCHALQEVMQKMGATIFCDRNDLVNSLSIHSSVTALLTV
jgi:hypothetical protein